MQRFFFLFFSPSLTRLADFGHFPRQKWNFQVPNFWSKTPKNTFFFTLTNFSFWFILKSSQKTNWIEWAWYGIFLVRQKATLRAGLISFTSYYFFLLYWRSYKYCQRKLFEPSDRICGIPYIIELIMGHWFFFQRSQRSLAKNIKSLNFLVSDWPLASFIL